MTRKPVTITAVSDVAGVVDIFNNHIFSCVPVVDDDGYPVGIVSWREVLKSLKDEAS